MRRAILRLESATETSPFLFWLGLATSKWHSWKQHYGKANEHNAWILRDHWLEDE